MYIYIYMMYEYMVLCETTNGILLGYQSLKGHGYVIIVGVV